MVRSPASNKKAAGNAARKKGTNASKVLDSPAVKGEDSKTLQNRINEVLKSDK